MPLNKGAKPGTKKFGDNIAELERSGHPKNQSIAIAYAEARKKKTKTKRSK